MDELEALASIYGPHFESTRFGARILFHSKRAGITLASGAAASRHEVPAVLDITCPIGYPASAAAAELCSGAVLPPGAALTLRKRLREAAEDAAAVEEPVMFRLAQIVDELLSDLSWPADGVSAAEAAAVSAAEEDGALSLDPQDCACARVVC